MIENFKDFCSSHMKIGLGLLEDESQVAEIETQGSLQDFINAHHTYMPGRALLLDLVQQFPCRMEPGDDLQLVIKDSASRMPGFSNKSPGNFACTSQETMGLQEVIAALVIKKYEQDENYQRHIIAEDIVRNIVAYCEDKLINGCEDKIKGLLNVCGTLSTKREEKETRKEFYCRALKEYVSNAGRTPTHIVLPFKEILQFHVDQQDGACVCIERTEQGFSNKLFGIPVISSDALSGEHGLILAVDDIVLASSPGLKWEFIRGYGNLGCGGMAILLSFTMGLLVKRPGTVAKLTWKGEEDPTLSSPSAGADKEKGQRQDPGAD